VHVYIPGSRGSPASVVATLDVMGSVSLVEVLIVVSAVVIGGVGGAVTVHEI